jgi:hypothetical protein
MSCASLLVDEGLMKINNRGDVALRGGQIGGSGGFTMLLPSEVWYCGKRKNQCRCGRCDGQCGPANGCPCRDCAELLVMQGMVLQV